MPLVPTTDLCFVFLMQRLVGAHALPTYLDAAQESSERHFDCQLILSVAHPISVGAQHYILILLAWLSPRCISL